MDKKVGGVIHEKCKGCTRIVQHYLVSCCSVYADPRIHWRREYTGGIPVIGSRCPMATHLEAIPETTRQGKIRAGQQKQRKRR